MRYIFYHKQDAEIDHVVRLLSQLDWFAANHYALSLPANITAHSARTDIARAVRKEFTNYEKRFRTYEHACHVTLRDHHVAIETFFSLFDYPLPDTITVHCTAYGPGGSYAPPDTITVMIKDIDHDPLRLIIHESVHLVLEEPFIQKYDLTHWEKEYIIDHLCKQSGIADFAQTYTIQNKAKSPSTDMIHNLRFAKKHLLIQ